MLQDTIVNKKEIRKARQICVLRNDSLSILKNTYPRRLTMDMLHLNETDISI